MRERKKSETLEKNHKLFVIKGTIYVDEIVQLGEKVKSLVGCSLQEFF